MFTLDPTLKNDTHDLGSFPLCRLLLINNKTYPWFILAPQREGIMELHQLDLIDREQLWKESALLSNWIEEVYAADKLNVAALGNVVSQLHVHHIARYRIDPAWPKPVWGEGEAVPYTEKEVAAIRKRVAEAFVGDLVD
jgi:diadenosine tetraphosphate (Ap4A) HIT family hydrolase